MGVDYTRYNSVGADRHDTQTSKNNNVEGKMEEISSLFDSSTVMRSITHYSSLMIINFRHKGLQQYYEAGNGSKLPAQYLRKINRIFDQLDAVTSVKDIQEMGSSIHRLTGDMAEFWSITVTPNYRLIFRFDAGDVYDVDYVDYH